MNTTTPCTTCPHARNSINGMYCALLSVWVEHTRTPLCGKPNK